MKSTLQRIVCILLVVLVLSMSLSAFAVDDEDEDDEGDEEISVGDRWVAQQYLVAYYIYQFLNSIGIQVSYQGIIEYNDQVQDAIIDWIVAYIGDLIELDQVPSTYSINEWIAPWVTGYDYWGNLQFNSTMLEDLEDFAEWLKQEFGLIDNSTQQIDPTYTVINNVGDVSFSLYKTNKYYSAEPYPNLQSVTEFNGNNAASAEYLQCIESQQNDIYYFFWANSEDMKYNGAFMKCIFVSEVAYPDNYTNTKIYDYSLQEVGYQEPNYIYLNESHRYANVYAYISNPNHEYWYDQRNGKEHYYAFIPANCTYLYGTQQDLENFLNVAEINIESMSIVTGTIELPSSNPDYVSGEGMIIIDGKPSYENITFSGEVTNLPAVISPATIQNPDLNSAYQEITPFFRTMESGLDIVRGIVLRLPVEVLSCLFALMGTMVIFGILKIMREH